MRKLKSDSLPAQNYVGNSVLLPNYNVIKKAGMFLAAALLLASCVKNDTNDKSLQEMQSAKLQELSSCTSGCWIGTVNQAPSSKKVEIYDPAVSDWNLATALKYSWKPTTALGYTSTEVSHWGDPNDFKIRTITAYGGGNFMAAIGNGGLVTLCTYPGGVKKWAVSAGSASTVNVHGVEMLPNGNIAIAASAGGFVRVYASSVAGSTASASYTLSDAHAVLWDPAYNCLWAYGNNKLVKLSVTGTAAAPGLSLVTTYTVPWGGGHALGAKYGNIDQLYVASGSYVYIFDKTTGSFTTAPGNINRVGVKAISNQPVGTVVLTRPDSIKTPIPSQPATYRQWNTSYVDFYSAAGVYQSSGHKTGAAFYKGFVYNTNYQ